MVSLILLCVFLFFVAFSAFVGLIRGMNKALIRLITFAFAMVLTFFVSALATNLIAEKVLIEGQTLGNYVLEMIESSDEMVADFLASAPLLAEAILVAPAFAIGIVAFPVIFFLLSFISWIVFRCIQKPLRKRMFNEQFPKTKEEKKEMKKNRKPFLVRMGKRFAGMGIGAVTGALIFGMLFVPVLGLISVLPENNALYEVIDTMVDQDILDADTAKMIKDEIAVRDQALLKSYRLLGFGLAGKLYLSSVSRIEYEGQKTNIPAEFDSVFSVAQVAIEGGLLKAVLDTENPKAIFAVLSNQEFVDELIGEMFKSRLFCAAIPEVMAIAMESVAISLNVPADKNAVYNNMMDDIAVSVKEADIDYAGIKAYEDAQVAADYVAADSAEEPAIMTKEEYEAEIQKLVDLTLKISKIINTAVSGSNEEIASTLADKIVQNVKNDVVENGTDLSGFDVESVVTAISEISADDVSSQEILDQLTDPNKFETDVTTVETITQSIRESVESAVADKSKASETASTLASVVSNLASAVDGMIDENGNIATDENGNVDIGSLDFSKIADAVTTLQNSNLKDVGSSMLDLVVSGDLAENEIVSEAIGAIKESYDNGEDLGGTINSAGALIVIGTTMGNNNGEASKENIANSFKDLVQNLNETTLKLLSSVLSEETLLSMGVDKEFAAIAFDVVDALLRELMELKNSANYEEEVNTVLEIYDIISAGNIEDEQVENLVRQMLKSRVIMNTLERVSTDILSAELLISLDVPAEYADEIYTAISASINEMIKIRNANAEAYNAEIDTLVSVYGILAKGDMTEEQIVELVGKMMKSNVVMNILDRVSEDILTADLLISMDVSEKYAEDICTAITACIDEMLAIRNENAEKYNAEIDAMASMLITLKDKELTDKELAKELIDFAKNSDMLYNVLMKVSDSIVIEIAEDDLDDIKQGIEEYYGETDKTEKDRAIFNAVAKIFAVEVTLQ